MADAFDLSGILELSSQEFTGPANDAAEASEGVAGSTDEMSEGLLSIEPAGIAAGGALAGVATAAQGVLDETQDTRESLNRTAVTMGVTSDEAENLATEMSNSTFPLSDVTGAMDSLAQQGIESEEQMKDVAESADLLADATGTTATSVAQNAGPALRAMGSDIDELEQHMDTFTAVARNTTQDVEGFSSMVERAGPELQEMGMGVDETAQVMMALEDQGLSGRQAIREFRQATNDADGDQEEFYDTLGISEDQLGEYEETLVDAEGSTEDHAEAANESLSTMDELRAGFEDAKLAAADYLGPLEGLMPAAQTAGIAMMGLSMVNMTALVPSFAAVTAAASGILIPLAAIGAAIAAAYVIWERDIGGIQEKTAAAKEAIVGAFQGIIDFVGEAFDTLDYLLTEWDPTDAISDTVDGMVETVTGIPDAITDTFSDTWNATVGGFGIDINGFDVSVPSWVPEVGGRSFGWDGFSAAIPEMATGGFVRSDGLVRAGEEGDEAILNAEQTAEVEQGEVDLGGGDSGDRIASKLDQILAALSDLGVVVEIDADGVTIDDVDARLERQKRLADNRGYSGGAGR